jgi:hypothetical protein
MNATLHASAIALWDPTASRSTKLLGSVGLCDRYPFTHQGRLDRRPTGSENPPCVRLNVSQFSNPAHESLSLGPTKPVASLNSSQEFAAKIPSELLPAVIL